MDLVVWIVFGLVYAAMLVGRLPGLALDRTGVALLGAIALLATGRTPLARAAAAVDLPTILLLFGLMVVSAQFRLGGFYSEIVRRMATRPLAPRVLLALLVALAGLLSALLANDIVCLAATPVLIEACARRRLNPTPFLLALACAANVGSAATLIGNPQNMLIGQVLRLDFGAYLARALGPVLLGLGLTWWVIARRYRHDWYADRPAPVVPTPPFNRWQTAKGLGVIAFVVAVFLWAPWPREIVALAAAGVLLCSRRMRSREMLGLVDWQLLVLFIALFVVNDAMQASGVMARLYGALRGVGIEPSRPAWLFTLSVALSNLVSNVPATMLLLPGVSDFQGGVLLALSSTLAGNLIVVGSLANIIVIEQAARLDVRVSWREHARVGVPVTLLTLAVTALWLRWVP